MSSDQKQTAPEVTAGQRLKALRLDRKLSPQNVADRLGLRLARYEDFERCLTAAAQGQYLGALTRILQVSPGDIVEQEPKKTEAPELSQAARECLAIRACKRRESLRLSKAEIAPELGITARQLTVRETCLLAEPEALEATWERALRVPSGWLRDESISTPPIPGVATGKGVAPAGKRAVVREMAGIEG